MKSPSLFQRAAQWFAVGKPQVRRFQAARVDRLTADWFSTQASINHELRSDLDRLRARGRDLSQNNDYAVKFVGMVKNNIIGPGGVRLQVRVEDSPGKQDRMANDAIESAWKDWSSGCDLSGRQSLRDVCETLVGGLPCDGEFLVRIVRGAESGNKYGIALQLIDVDRIDTTFNGTHGNNHVIMGVEVDAYRSPVAVHIFAAHPNDGAASSRQRIRLPVADTLHRFKMERAEQMRGIPWMAPSMLSLHHLGSFKLSALLAAEHGANHYGFFTTPDGQSPLVNEASADGVEQITTSQPGTYDTLPVGSTFTPHESRYPNEVFGPFVKTTLQRIASGWRVAYHSLANDLEGVSYSSIRSGSLEERDRWAADQEWFISVFMEPVYKMWLQMALNMGAITMPNGSALPAAKLAKFSKHEWQARRWEWVDPKGDMEAKILAVKAGLMAPQDLASAMGYDFEDTLSSIASAQKQAAALGVQLTAYDPTPGAQSAQPQPDTTTAAKELQTQQTARSLEQLGTAMAALATRDTKPAVVNITNNMPEQRHETHHHIAAPAVEVRNEINMPETTVNVEAIMPEQRTEPAAAPVINITNDVQPAPITVNNTHPSRAVQVVERDANDEIISTVTTYET